MKKNQQHTLCDSLLDKNESTTSNNVVRARHQEQIPLQSVIPITSSYPFFSCNNQTFAQADHQANLGDNTIYPYHCHLTKVFDTSSFHQKETYPPIFHNTESNYMGNNMPKASSVTTANKCTQLAPSSSAVNDHVDILRKIMTIDLLIKLLTVLFHLAQDYNSNNEGLIPISTKIRHGRTMTFTSTRLRSTLKKKTFVYEYQELPKRYECTVCGKKFVRPSSLTTHSYSHTGEVCNSGIYMCNPI